MHSTATEAQGGVSVKKSQILKPLEAEPSRGPRGAAKAHRRLRARDIEALRRLLDGGMEVAVLQSAFTDATGRAHWEVLLRARAIENLVWIIAAAQEGEHPNGRRTFGHSMIVDPWGTVLGRLNEGTGLVIVDIDLNRQAKIRADFPSLKHRRKHIWKQLND